MPINADLYVHITYFNTSKIFKFLGRIRPGTPVHMRPWTHSWLNRPLITPPSTEDTSLAGPGPTCEKLALTLQKPSLNFTFMHHISEVDGI